MTGKIDRREFLARSTKVAGGLFAGGMLTSCSRQHKGAAAKEAIYKPNEKLGRRVAVVGTGWRCLKTWGPPLEKKYSDYVEVVGLCDTNPRRAEYVSRQFVKKPPTFTDFDKMIHTTRPDTVIITTVDRFHPQYVIRAMELGCDVICEKPFATEDGQCRELHKAQKKYKKNIIVTFNARYGPGEAKVKELILAGEIGEIYSVNYDELLDIQHGASYFRRWHGYIKNGGSLLVTKACHHFDELNWWLESDPVEVIAYGALKKYGRNGRFRSVNCRGCPHKSKCEFYFDITKNRDLMELYVNCESDDGYLRDACLYRSDLDTYDTNTVMIKYANGVLASYNLDATLAYEGQHIAINGSKGRIDLYNHYAQPWEEPNTSEIRLTRNFKDSIMIYPETESTPDVSGGHLGADDQIRNHVFKGKPTDDLKQRGTARAGILSSLIGIAGYKSIRAGSKAIRIKDLIDMDLV